MVIIIGQEFSYYFYLIYIILLYNFYSVRIMPHHQNTGGFFVTVLEKIKLLPWEQEYLMEVTTENSVNIVEHKKKPKKRKFQGYKEDPFVFLTDDDPIWPEIK